MPPAPVETIDLLDLKLLPAWVKEPSEGKNYADYEGGDEEQARPSRGRDRDFRQPRERGRKRPSSKPDRADRRQERPARGRSGRPDQARQDRPREQPPPQPLPEVAVRFVPHAAALESVTAQIQSGSVAYSLFAIARLFLEKPERYDVRLTAKQESPLYQLGEDGAVSSDRASLEASAFRLATDKFYKTEVVQTEPIKGNFMSVARCRLSGTVLGPPNHHNYQPRLRSLYEQRFSRRMSFADYQKKIEMVSDPAAVEKWKEDARSVTTFTTLQAEPAATFNNGAEAEKHFQQNYLPGLLRSTEEIIIDGVASRRLADRSLYRVVENAWSSETRSPSNIMQELARQFRENSGLHIFRHRRGMLFVSPIRVRAFVHDESSVSPAIKQILETLAANPGTNRKDLAAKLFADATSEDAENRKLTLASDLHWLISEGYVIEFNDGSLDLPRAKTPNPKPQSPGKSQDPISNPEPPAATDAAPVSTAESPKNDGGEVVAAAARSRKLSESPAAEPAKEVANDVAASPTEDTQIGGS